MKRIVVFTGAGISAESGIKTFRDSGGLWEDYPINDVATPNGWIKDPALVLEFYNLRRKQILEAIPNAAHIALSELQLRFDVHIITQNIDNLHERAGSKKVLHLHGEVIKSRSTIDPSLIYDITGVELNIGDMCAKGSQLRPDVVWFGEEVPNMIKAFEISNSADIFIVVGTSLNVYPAAGLLNGVNDAIPKYLIDPTMNTVEGISNLILIKEKAGTGVPALINKLLA